MIIKHLKRILSAFTLVEILIVSTVIGLVTIFSVVNGQTQLQKTRDAVRKSNIDQIKLAIEEYYQDKECYPQALPTCGNSFQDGSKVIIDSIPCDPTEKLSYTYVPETSNCPKSYQLYATLEYKNDGIIDKIGCRNGCGPECQFNYGVASTNEKLNPFCDENLVQDSPSAIATQIPINQPTEVIQYVCSPNGNCEAYSNPEISDCPNVYVNDPLCQNTCTDRKQRCHDARGKKN